MIVSVTPLGDASGNLSPVEIAGRIANYLQGAGLARAGRHPGASVELPALSGEGTVAYYADSTGIRPGRWLGSRSGDVDPAELVAVLAGVHPETGEALESAPTSVRGRRRDAEAAVLEDGRSWFDTFEAARAIGVKHTYLQRLAKGASTDLDAGGDGCEPPERRSARGAALAAMQTGDIRRGRRGSWRFSREALITLLAARRPATDVFAYDVTFSVPKDLSVIWARGDDEVRANVLSAIDHGIAAGVSYLERHALQVRVDGEQQEARSWVGAEFLHLTSRALDPQIHKHVLVVNRAETENGESRALDGRLLFLHAKTAGYVAAAELRHQLAARLGVEHGEVRRGIAPILGVRREVVEEFSTRSREIAEAVAALGVDSAAARQVAAYDTRAVKEAGFDFDEVTAWWQSRMDRLGFDAATLAGVLNRVDGPRVLTEASRDQLLGELLRVDGVTEHEARFDRRHVVQVIAERAVERLSGEAVEELADRFLGLDQVVELGGAGAGASRDVIRLADGRAVTVGLGASYSTRSMLALEDRAMQLYEAGRAADAGAVPADVLRSVLADERFAHLSDEQRRFVTKLTTSGQQTQAAVGRAGSGKTTALEVAVAAWRAAGYHVLGSAVGGTQSVLLGEEATGEAQTVASVLARYFDYDDTGSLDGRTVLLVDEASLVSTHDIALLERAVAEHPGAALRLVGDEEQHSSVAAGGFFRWLVETHPAEVPQLTTVHRQQGEQMAEVRLALDEYRAGRITEALDRLERDGRIVEADSPSEAYDLLACAWYTERRLREADAGRPSSSMIAEHHHERSELNLRARALLKADGTLTGPELVVGGAGFQRNDEVIARVGDRSMRAEGAGRDQWVRNGSRGVVREVAAEHLIVEFERWGRVTVPSSYIDREVVPGIRGGLAHSYALTTYAVQGATMAAAMPLLTDASTREGTYVSLTRPQLDLNAICIRYDRVVPAVVDDELPAVRGEARDLEATARSLERDRRERLASQSDPSARRVNELAASMTLDVIEDALDSTGDGDEELLGRALRERLRLVGLHGVTNPDPDVVARLGPRPVERERRRTWDAAAGAVAIYRERRLVAAVPTGRVEWALGPRPEQPLDGEDYDRCAALVVAALVQFPAGDRADAEPSAAWGQETVGEEFRCLAGSTPVEDPWALDVWDGDGLDRPDDPEYAPAGGVETHSAGPEIG